MNLYEDLKELGCSNPLAAIKEYNAHGVTKFYDHQLRMVTVRNVNGWPAVTYPKLK